MYEGFLLGLSHILTNTPYFILAGALFWRERRFSAKMTALVFGSLILAHGISDFLLTAFYTGGFYWLPIQFISFCVVSIALLLVMYRITFSKALYAFLLIRAVYTAILYIVLNAFMLANPGVYIGFDATPAFTLAAVLAMGAAFPFLWRYVTGMLRTAFSELDEKTIRQLCVPPVLFFLLDQCYSTIRDTLEYDSFQTAAIFILMLGTGLVTYYVNLRMVMENWNRTRLESEKDKQLALSAQGYENLTRSIEEANIARHDLRHHINVMQQLAARGSLTELNAYLTDYVGSLPEDTISPICQNYTVDAIARHYLTIARKAGAVLNIKIQLPQDAGIPISDLCIVFGNILENAAESCVRQTSGHKFINARCESSNGRIVLAVDNSGDKTPGKLKHGQSKGEGVGLRSALTVAERYGGTLEFKFKDGVYQTSVIMMTE